MRGKAGVFSQRQPTDANFSDVVLLLHMNGSNGSTTFTDASSSPKTVTTSGDVQISTSQSKFGGASALFDGSDAPPGHGDYLKVASTSELDLPGDFTIECWLRAVSPTVASGIAVRRVLNALGAGTWGLLLEYGVAKFFNLGSGTPATIGTLSLNTWTHLAVTRSGSTLRTFLDGVLNATQTDPTNFTNTNDLFLGAWDRAGAGSEPTRYWLDGYIDEFRITKGVARYTETFTPPVNQFPDA